MEAVVISWPELLVVVVAVLAVYAAELVILLKWSAPRGLRPWRRDADADTQPRLLNGLSLEISELRKQVARLQSEVERLKSATPPAVSPYNQAIQMARQGLSASEVASGCGISRGEAELIVALYRKLRI